MCSVQYAVFSVQCAVCSVQCAVLPPVDPVLWVVSGEGCDTRPHEGDVGGGRRVAVEDEEPVVVGVAVELGHNCQVEPAGDSDS